MHRGGDGYICTMPSQITAVVGGRVVPVVSEPIEGGTVLIEGGRITMIGAHVDVPEGSDVIDATGLWVLPGFLDAHTHVGINEESSGPAGNDVNETSRPLTAGVRALDAIDCEDIGFKDALSAGITSVGVKPGSGNPIGGQTVVVKTWGGSMIDDQVVSGDVSVKFALGENPKQVHGADGTMPMTRLGTAYLIRQAFEDARNYAELRAQAEKDGSPFRRDLDLEALARVLAGELAWDVHVHRHDDIATALRIAEEFDLRLVINHGTEAHRLAKALADRKIPVVVGPIITARSKSELAGHTIDTAATLDRAGVRIALCTDHPEVPVNLLVLQAALAVRQGLPRDVALRALSVNPAAILGVDNRIGALAPGLDGDVVLWSGDPLDMDTRALQVLISGQTVYRWDDEAGGQTLERFSALGPVGG